VKNLSETVAFGSTKNGRVHPSTWRPGPLIEVEGVETRVEREADNSTNFLLCLSKPIKPPPKPDWL